MKETIRQLIATATPGPWGYDLNHTVGRHEDGEWQESVAQLPAGTHKRRPTPQERADMTLIARCNPEVMTKVVRYLELIETNWSENPREDARVALTLLNGETT